MTAAAMPDTPAARRPHPWEAQYPDGVRWDAPIVPDDLAAMFRRFTAQFAAQPALDYRATEWSYAELARRVRVFANALIRQGFGPGQTLALYLPNTAWHPVAFFGALTAGGRVAQLSPLDPKRVLAHKLTDSGAVFLLTVNLPQMQEMALTLRAEGHVPQVILCDEGAFGPFPGDLAPITAAEGAVPFDAFVAGAPEDDPQIAVDPEAVALLQYTGGTTGLPKGAMLTHANLTAALQIYDAWYSGREEMQRDPGAVMCVLPLFHIYALSAVLLRYLRLGAKVLIRMRFDAEAILNDIERHRVTAFAGVPTMWIALVNFPGIEGRDLSSLTLTASGGAPLPVEVGRRFLSLTGHELLGGWGMTETSPAGTSIPEGAAARKPGTVGLPLPGVEMKIVALDDATRDLPPGETGEIAVRGPNITRGYWNRPDAGDVFRDGWFLTGDVGHMDADGFFWLVDRRTDMIISGGYNVYPQMVEQAIYEHPAVAEAMVIGRPDGYRGESARAYVVLRAGHEPFTLEDLREFLKERLGPHEMPRGLEFRETLPRTPVGKFSRKMLRDAEDAAAAGSAAGA